MFSSRLRQGTGRNRLALTLDRRRAAGLPIVDLTESNPTRTGFDYPSAMLQPLADPRSLSYEPQPFGLATARDAVSRDFARRGVDVPPERIILTASTSDAYSLLFKLLCDPGDTVLAPKPSYPLVEHLAGLDGVSVEYYSLEFHGRWSIDLHGCQEKLLEQPGRHVRAIVTISPNNPTGSAVTPAELAALTALARERGVALVSDEVFADYAISGSLPPSVLAGNDVLTFGLGGLSKSIGLPQVKLGWIGVSGPGGLVTEALARLEIICDAYLSVSTPVQVAAPRLLEHGSLVRAQIQDRIRENYGRLTRIAALNPSCSLLPVEAGWCAVIQVPAVRPEETIVLELLERTGVLVHPGYFFDFEREAFLVVSLLPEPAIFSPAVETLFGEIGLLR